MSPTTAQLLSSSDAFFTALCCNTPALNMLSYFSTTHPVAVQHYPATCPHPHTSRLVGPNAIRSYFDLLATHWTHSDVQRHSSAANSDTRQVIVSASVAWTWKKSRRTWTESFTCTLEFDEALKIVNLIIRTESPPGTCVMRATDADPVVIMPLKKPLSY